MFYFEKYGLITDFSVLVTKKKKIIFVFLRIVESITRKNI